MSLDRDLKDECTRILAELVPALSRTQLSPRADNLAFLASNVLAKLGAELENIARGSVEAEEWAKAVLAERERKETEQLNAPLPDGAMPAEVLGQIQRAQMPCFCGGSWACPKHGRGA